VALQLGYGSGQLAAVTEGLLYAQVNLLHHLAQLCHRDHFFEVIVALAGIASVFNTGTALLIQCIILCMIDLVAGRAAPAKTLTLAFRRMDESCSDVLLAIGGSSG
jgi:hypothetical protein